MATHAAQGLFSEPYMPDSTETALVSILTKEPVVQANAKDVSSMAKSV